MQISCDILSLHTQGFQSADYPCNKPSSIRFVYIQYHTDNLKCTEQNVNNQTLTQVSQLYVHVSFCLKLISRDVIDNEWIDSP